MNDVLIYSPFSWQDGQGNSVTADRMERIFESAGMSYLRLDQRYQGECARCLVVLNARRSAGVVAEFKRRYPGVPVVVVLTGTDINHAEMLDEFSATRRTVVDADALVVLNDAGFEEVAALPGGARAKSQIIRPGARLPEGLGHQPEGGDDFRVVMAGNLRPVKSPRLAVAACGLLPEGSRVRVVVFGAAEGGLERMAREASERLDCYEWQGGIAHEVLLREMARSHLLLNTSSQEGGANAICEALALGLPVVASRIPGNSGMLGDHYEGYFPSGDARALAELLLRCARDDVFYRSLKAQVSERAFLFSYEEEERAWVRLVRSLLSC